MDWFAARDLGLRRVAIRREGWKYWMIYRAKVWMIIDSILGVETRRVVRATDFRDSEFLAKDWTATPWEGGTIPPCTIPADEVKGSVLPTSHRWTLTEFCGGDGDGGNVVPVMPPGDDPVVIGNPADIGLTMILLQSVNANGDAALVPDSSVDGVACWVTPPTNFWVWACCKVSAEYAGAAYPFLVALNVNGADLSDLDFNSDGEPPVGTYFRSTDAEGNVLHSNHPAVLGTPNGEPWYAHQFIYKENAIAYVPGGTITAVCQVTYKGSVYRTTASIALPAICED